MTAPMKPRDLASVLGDCLGLIPADKVELRQKLTQIRRELPYRAPELIKLSWREAQRAINQAIGPWPNLDSWHGPFLRAWKGEP